MSPPLQWGKDHEQIADAVAFIFIIIALWFAWLAWQGLSRFFDLLFAGFIDADQWAT